MASRTLLLFFGFALLMTLDACAPPKCKDKVAIKYTLFIGDDISRVESIHLVLDKDSTFYQAMEKAAEEDWSFQFIATQNSLYGHYITCIGGLEQDLVNNKFWMIYITDGPANPSKPPRISDLSPVGVDSITVKNFKNYIFWYKTVIW